MLQDLAKLFEASSRFQTVASELLKIINNPELTCDESKTFDWVANLLGQIDWDSEPYKQETFTGLTVLATELRPLFYQSLVRLDINSGRFFLDRVYDALKTYGKNCQLSANELNQAQQLFQCMATDILVQFSHPNI